MATAPTLTDEQLPPDDAEQQYAPGQLCPADATNDRVELDDDGGEDGLTADDKETCLKSLASKISQRDMVSYRSEVRDAWKQRFFGRGNQKLTSGPKGVWLTPSQIPGGQQYDNSGNETNIYLATQDILVASLTAGLPSVRFEAQDQNNPVDVSAAEEYEDARMIVERDNNMITVQADKARFLCTDGRACTYTRYVLDQQRFGVLEDGSPRGREIFEVSGVLETKLRIQSDSISSTPYLQYSKEVDVTFGKTLYPDKAEDIQPNAAPTAESDFARLARTSIMLGMRPSATTTSDSLTSNTTWERTWIKPEFFAEEKQDAQKQWLYATFPKGAMVSMMGTTFCEARNESMQDHWSLCHARPGDGMHRPSLLSPVVPIQEKLNDCMDYTHDAFMHLIPKIWVASGKVDQKALNDVTSAANQYFQIAKTAGEALGENFHVEDQIQLAEGLLTYIQNLFGEWLQFLSGAYPALFGGNTGSNDTASGIASQRDQALGRIGLTWRAIKASYAEEIRQAVAAAAEYRTEAMSGSVAGKNGQTMQLSIDPNDLKGNVLCFPDSDENFPESWVQKRGVWTNILGLATKVPEMAAIIGTAKNLRVAKNYVGVPELEIPGADAEEKQEGQIQKMLADGPPLPNPALQQAQQMLPQVPPELQQPAQAEIAQMAPLVSTVPIDPDVDDMETMIATTKNWANSQDGIRAKADNPDGYQNVITQMKERMAFLAQQQPPPPAQKPPSERSTSRICRHQEKLKWALRPD